MRGAADAALWSSWAMLAAPQLAQKESAPPAVAGSGRGISRGARRGTLLLRSVIGHVLDGLARVPLCSNLARGAGSTGIAWRFLIGPRRRAVGVR
jgi:hypothetical protein